jgi:hypothetical protein
MSICLFEILKQKASFLFTPGVILAMAQKKSRLAAGCTNQIPLTIKPYPMKIQI